MNGRWNSALSINVAATQQIFIAIERLKDLESQHHEMSSARKFKIVSEDY